MAVAPPRPKGPPLNPLRAFEAAARLGSFTSAAQEMNVSAGAIAQHVKAVEAWAGAALFDRHPQGVRLNRLGQRVLPDFTEAFDLLGEASRKLRLAAAPDKIRIAALPSIAQLWLSPRLPKIRKAVPSASISVSALEQPPNVARDHYDICLFYLEDEEVLEDGVVRLSDDVIYPVAAPEVAREIDSLEKLAEIACLEDATWNTDWGIWLASAGADNFPILKGPAFSLYALAVEETRNGAGVLIGHHDLITADLEAGRLVRLFETRADTGRVLGLKAAPGGDSPYLRQVTDLLVAEMTPEK